jgi:hypothetical protein
MTRKTLIEYAPYAISLIALILAIVSLYMSMAEEKAMQETEGTNQPSETALVLNPVEHQSISNMHIIRYVTEFIDTQTFVGYTVGSDSIWYELHLVRTYDVGENEVFHGKCDVYDNGLALHFLTCTNQVTRASLLARSILTLMVNEGWFYTAETSTDRIASFKLLSVRYGLNGDILSDELGIESMLKDVGNNSYIAMALAKFGLALAGEDAKMYIQAAYDILLKIHTVRLNERGDYKGYMARVDKNSGIVDGSYLSTEHHVDMYALAMIFEKNREATSKYLSTEEQSVIMEVKKISEAFIQSMWDTERNMFNTGTGYINGTGSVMKNQENLAVDCQTWTVLCGASRDRHKQCLEWAVKECLTVDTPVGGVGCVHGINSETAFVPISPCSVYTPSELYTGFKFTNRGNGIQLENTGSGLLALLIHQADHDGDGAAVTSQREALLESMRRLICDHVKNTNTGIPGSFRKEKLYPRLHYMEKDGKTILEPNYMFINDKNAHETNTGMSWSYYTNPHMASTIYCALSLMFSQDPTFAYNPYSHVTVPFDTSYTKTHIKAFIEGRLESLEWALPLKPMDMTLLTTLKEMLPEEKNTHFKIISPRSKSTRIK